MFLCTCPLRQQSSPRRQLSQQPRRRRQQQQQQRQQQLPQQPPLRCRHTVKVLQTLRTPLQKLTLAPQRMIQQLLKTPRDKPATTLEPTITRWGNHAMAIPPICSTNSHQIEGFQSSYLAIADSELVLVPSFRPPTHTYKQSDTQ
eukprot:Blabericola_migrator_1__6040@NODE_3042_length_2092_cov_5_023210_g1899_i0_p2_GENE_NODE_3042_length_2092_cov_5_023210_g1899_i0NODE_3042_length_2092_cov_5_023210_g1899_i0_p2_ORF_typecomplete_len145_score11_62DUF4834/PF16118_5/3_9_NODE_3042_length_2092_cov_5_023210_g1899_i0359793